jgi:hypothetical protein
MKRFLGALAFLSLATATSAAPAPAVGDPDSFGRGVIHLGVANPRKVRLVQGGDCASISFEQDCVAMLQPDLSTVFTTRDSATISLPARAANSLLCFTLSSRASRQFRNSTASVQFDAAYTVDTVVTLKSEVLDDPTLVDPDTHLPFNGSLRISLNTQDELFDLVPGQGIGGIVTASRGCENSLISKRTLMLTHGLTQAQADAFFEKPIRVSVGLRGGARFMLRASYSVVLRLYGDAR